MPREYTTKGPDRLSVSLNVPMKEGDVDVLSRTAASYGMSKTQLAREYILVGLGLQEQPQRTEGAA